MLTRQQLGGRWEFAPAKPGKLRAPTTGWRKAMVPGNVHTDLMAAGRLTDPHIGRNEEKAGWVENLDWWYRRTFIPDKALLECRKLQLVAEGLDTIAEIYINGKRAGFSQNMFVEHRFDIAGKLRRGKNEICIRLASPTAWAEGIEARQGQWPAINYSPGVWLRKAQYAFGWDWGPRLGTLGIFRPLYIEGMAGDVVRDVHVTISKLGPSLAEGKVEVTVQAQSARKAWIQLHIGPWNKKRWVSLKAGSQVISTSWKLHNPVRWWPAGYGAPFLYDVEAMLDTGHLRRERAGLRTVELERKKDKAGESFAIKVNGIAMFCKGANWIPVDSFLNRVDKTRVNRLVDRAHDSGLNMLRIWGGGIYEDENFYQRCDERGIMVWQDFPFACSEIPETPWLMKEIALEAEKAVRRLRRHTSLVLWCGNNENHMAHDAKWFGARSRKEWGKAYYHKVLPGVVRRLDSGRPYWPGSPYSGNSGEDANSPNYGDRHNWDVWHGSNSYYQYREDKSRFVSEFGFAALAGRRVLEKAIPKGERWLQSKTVQAHEKCVAGHHRIMGHLVDHLPLATDLDSFRYLSQVNQAEALRIGIEHWRRNMPHTMGTLFWQWNDCWPVTSWAVLDSDDRARLACHAVARAYDPVLLSGLVHGGDELFSKPGMLPRLDADGEARFWLSVDGRIDSAGTLVIERWGPEGFEKKLSTVRISQKSGTSSQHFSMTRTACGIKDVEEQYLVAWFDNGKQLRRTPLFFARPRRLKLKKGGITASIHPARAGQSIKVKAGTLVRCLELDSNIDGDFSENGFDLLPGETKEVIFRPRGKGILKRAGLSWRSLNDLIVPRA